MDAVLKRTHRDVRRRPRPVEGRPREVHRRPLFRGDLSDLIQCWRAVRLRSRRVLRTSWAIHSGLCGETRPRWRDLPFLRSKPVR
jgi:hypothetical protein